MRTTLMCKLEYFNLHSGIQSVLSEASIFFSTPFQTNAAGLSQCFEFTKELTQAQHKRTAIDTFTEARFMKVNSFRV